MHLFCLLCINSLLYFFVSNFKFYFFLKFEATTILTQGASKMGKAVACPSTQY
ncbi:MAG: hypothetical protein RLZZ419_1231 [Pseudomonadota bacterium]